MEMKLYSCMKKEIFFVKKVCYFDVNFTLTIRYFAKATINFSTPITECQGKVQGLLFSVLRKFPFISISSLMEIF